MYNGNTEQYTDYTGDMFLLGNRERASSLVTRI